MASVDVLFNKGCSIESRKVGNGWIDWIIKQESLKFWWDEDTNLRNKVLRNKYHGVTRIEMYNVVLRNATNPRGQGQLV